MKQEIKLFILSSDELEKSVTFKTQDEALSFILKNDTDYKLTEHTIENYLGNGNLHFYLLMDYINGWPKFFLNREGILEYFVQDGNYQLDEQVIEV